MKSKPCIFHIIDSLAEMGGAETLLTGSLKNLGTEYTNIIITLRAGNKFSRNDQTNDSKIICLQQNRHRQSLNSILLLRRLVKQYNPSIIHSHLFWSTIIARLSIPKTVALVSTYHSYYFDPENRAVSSLYIRLLEKLTFNRRFHAIFLSESQRNRWQEVFNRTKGNTHILPNYIDENFHKNPKNDWSKSHPIKALMVGHLKLEKNYTFIIKSLSEEKLPEIKLDIYGNGPLKKEILEYIDDTGLDTSVNLMGSSENIDEKLLGYDLFIMASTFEGFGIALVEAMAKKVPIICSDIEIFKDLTNGHAFYFRNDNTASFKEALRAYSRCPKEELNLKVERNFIHSKKFTLPTYISNLLSIYKSIIK